MNSNKVSGFSPFFSNKNLLEYLNSVSIVKPTQVQMECIPKLLTNDSLSVQGRTGSGKTLGYLLPIIQKLKDCEDEIEDDKTVHPKVVIILPTRELALQVFSITKTISHFAKLRVRKLVGGDKGKSLASLYLSKMDILVTTPDRCLRSFKNRELSAASLKYLILDEADQLFDPSFKKTISQTASLLTNDDLQVILVSASRPENFTKMISEVFPTKSFQTVGKGEENILNHKVETYNMAFEEADKFSYIENFVKKQGKRNGLIFVGNKARAEKVYKLLKEKGHQKLSLLHKDMEIKERVLVVEKFRDKGGIMVTTDIFARGIDITHLEWVLNFDLPSGPDYYLHRSGRVGRAGRKGHVFNFITSRDKERLRRINETLITQGRNDLRLNYEIKSR